MSGPDATGFSEQDIRWMQHALNLAQTAAEQGEVPVGAVVVLNNTIIGEGYNRPISTCDPTSHAEIVALRSACAAQENYRIPGATLYVTLEPCSMCVGAIVHARIDRVVYGASEPKAGVVESQLNYFDMPFLNCRVSYEGGCLAPQCSELLSGFFGARRAQKKADKGPPDS